VNRRRTDSQTLDLLNWQPPALASGYSEADVRAATLRGRVSRAVAECLKQAKDNGIGREQVAAKMTEFLGEPVSKTMLEQYASQAREDQSISAVRLVALVHATGDFRVLQAMLDPLDYAAIPKRFVPCIRQVIIEDEIDRLSKQAEIERRSWKGTRP
jgi:hypothetical protein